MKINQTFIIAILSLSSMIQAAPESEVRFDAKYINEGSNIWPHEKYGKIFNVNVSEKKFDFVKNTVYDRKDLSKIIGRSWNCVHWSDKTRFIEIVSSKDFNEIKKPVLARFFVGHPKEREKMTKGIDFRAAKVKLYHDAKNTNDVIAEKKEFVGMFTPDGPLSGTVQIDSKTVKITMAKRRIQITNIKSVKAEKLNAGFWSAKIEGVVSGDRFVAKEMELTSLPDPRAGDDPKLPRLLVIGDSISMNFGSSAKEALKGIVNYHRNEGNSFSTYHGTQYADYWLGDYTKKGQQWDVIHFNHGMHDLKQSGPDAPYQTLLDIYKENLKTEIAILKKSGAKLIFCTTTPVHKSTGGKYGRQKGAEVFFNKAAMEVMKEYPEIQINDLCKVVYDSPVFDESKKSWDVHYYKPAERKLLGDAVAAAVKKALPQSDE